MLARQVIFGEVVDATPAWVKAIGKVFLWTVVVLGWAALILICSIPPGNAWSATVEENTVFSGVVSASADLVTIPVGTLREGTCVLNATAATGSPTVDLYLQSVVGGVDDDFCRFGQATGVSAQVLRFSALPVTTAAARAVSDRSTGVTASNCAAGWIGTRMKVAAVFGGSGTLTITLTCHFLRD